MTTGRKLFLRSKMDARILAEAKKDIPLYFQDFKDYWNSVSDNISDADLTDCYHATLIYKTWKLCLNHLGIISMDVLLNELHEDVNTSFFQSFFGLYRTAHMHLRSLIELSMQMVYFYQHEVEYAQWREGDFVIKHEALSTYLKKHSNFAGSQNLIDTLTSYWKRFSKHIHAEAPMYFQSEKVANSTKTFSIGDFNMWKNNYITAVYLTNKLFLLLFKDKIRLFPEMERKVLLRKLQHDDYTLLGIVP